MVEQLGEAVDSTLIICHSPFRSDRSIAADVLDMGQPGIQRIYGIYRM